MPSLGLAERRAYPRFPTDGLLVRARRKGRIGQLEGLASDFNRHGLAVILNQPLPKETTLFMTLVTPEMKLDEVIGVVHNCVSVSEGYRCGVQFRTGSDLQLDQAMVEEELAILEARFKVQYSLPA